MPKVEQAEFEWSDGMRRTRAYGTCSSCGWVGWTWDHVSGEPQCHDCVLVGVEDHGNNTVHVCHCGEPVTVIDPDVEPFYVETFTNDEHAAHVTLSDGYDPAPLDRGAVDVLRVLTLLVVLGIDVAAFVVLGRVLDGLRMAGEVLS